eukprot:1184476-Prorocentrum_minimum.AAC.2
MIDDWSDELRARRESRQLRRRGSFLLTSVAAMVVFPTPVKEAMTDVGGDKVRLPDSKCAVRVRGGVCNSSCWG